MVRKTYRLSQKIKLEAFIDGALVLRIHDRNIFELNAIAHHILQHTDGSHTSYEVAQIIADFYHIPRQEALQDVIVLYEQLNTQKIIEEV